MGHFFKGVFPQEGKGNWLQTKISATHGMVKNAIQFWKRDFIKNPRSF